MKKVKEVIKKLLGNFHYRLAIAYASMLPEGTTREQCFQEIKASSIDWNEIRYAYKAAKRLGATLTQEELEFFFNINSDKEEIFCKDAVLASMLMMEPNRQNFLTKLIKESFEVVDTSKYDIELEIGILAANRIGRDLAPSELAAGFNACIALMKLDDLHQNKKGLKRIIFFLERMEQEQRTKSVEIFFETFAYNPSLSTQEYENFTLLVKIKRFIDKSILNNIETSVPNR